MSGPVAQQSLLVDHDGDDGANGVEADGGGEVGSDEGEAEEALRPNGSSGDPYAGLSTAFGGSLMDEPKSVGNGSSRQDDADLLF